jgi:hypothetical protein
MTILINILQKIPSLLFDIGRKWMFSKCPIPRNLKISGHFRLNNENINQKSVCNELIIKLIEL